jgi:hypothetical protein
MGKLTKCTDILIIFITKAKFYIFFASMSFLRPLQCVDSHHTSCKPIAMPMSVLLGLYPCSPTTQHLQDRVHWNWRLLDLPNCSLHIQSWVNLLGPHRILRIILLFSTVLCTTIIYYTFLIMFFFYMLSHDDWGSTGCWNQILANNLACSLWTFGLGIDPKILIDTSGMHLSITPVHTVIADAPKKIGHGAN